MALCAAAFAATVLMTWPLASDIGHLGRTPNSGDARFAVWNVAWVAHALTTNPSALYDANIFYPHRKALAFSEANIGAGTIAIPVWIATHNAIAAHNFVVFVAFTASIVFTWLLARRLTGDGGAAATAAVLFAFCPYVFSHTAHIQLLMVGGIPLCLLAFHRLVDAPSMARGGTLGLALVVQALSCAYYGVSAGLTIGYATLFYAWARRLWRSKPYWMAIGVAAASSIAIVLPFFLPFLEVQSETGFARSLDDAQHWSAYWRSYLASGAHAHAWLLPIIRDWNAAVLFPGFVAVILGVAGAVTAFRQRASASAPERMSTDRETVVLYGSIGILTLWASLGPRAGLYTVLYNTIPVFSFLRAPERMGIVVALVFALFAAFAVRELRLRMPAHGRLIAIAACAAALIELNDLPFDWRAEPPAPAAYRALAAVPRGPVVEFPFFDRRVDFHIHTRYMLRSTMHWQPLVNGYSDHIPLDFRETAKTLATFPSDESFQAMRTYRIRYLTISRGLYGRPAFADVEARLQRYLPHLKLVADDGDVVIYEVVSWP
ncbi:MAG TPA: hypothetical protein VFJ02_18890 [Vicinamibacterales bacterium]|nr:hypothetical protein [Vicinamibacterales bacterium]